MRANPAPYAAWVAAAKAEFGVTLDEVKTLYRQRDYVPVSVLPVIGGLAPAAIFRWRQTGSTVRDMLLWAADEWTYSGHLSKSQVAGWLRVVAGAATWQAARAVVTISMSPTEGFAGEMSGWRGLPGAAGALGWAAGLTPVEAAGTPVYDLTVMAALRGWDLSGTPVAVGA